MSNPTIRCSNRKCGLICKEDDWKQIPDGPGATRGVCPRCHNESYYMAKPGEVEKAKSGVQLIELERHRQKVAEGFDSERDDKYTDFQLSKAAESYLLAVSSPDEWAAERGKLPAPASDWPWSKSWWKPSADPIRNLVKAGALIAAEIDRLQRAKGAKS